MLHVRTHHEAVVIDLVGALDVELVTLVASALQTTTPPDTLIVVNLGQCRLSGGAALLDLVGILTARADAGAHLAVSCARLTDRDVMKRLCPPSVAVTSSPADAIQLQRFAMLGYPGGRSGADAPLAALRSDGPGSAPAT